VIGSLAGLRPRWEKRELAAPAALVGVRERRKERSRVVGWVDERWGLLRRGSGQPGEERKKRGRRREKIRPSRN